MNILTSDSFNRPATEAAESLIGKFLIREYNGHQWALMITEVEAYDGPDDEKSYIHEDKSDDTNPMCSEAGVLYTHITPEADCLLAIVTGPKEYPAAILIRSALVMLPTGEIEHIDEPTKLTKFLRIDAALNGLRATKQNKVWFEDRDIAIPKEHIVRKKRINIGHETELNDALHNFSIEVIRNTSLRGE